MFKIVAVALVCAFILIYLKSVNSDFFSVATLGAGVVVAALGIEYLSQTLDFFHAIAENSGINAKYLAVILKITGISYAVEFGAGVIEDLGLKSIADKLVFVGKLAVITAALPIITAVFNLFSELI